MFGVAFAANTGWPLLIWSLWCLHFLVSLAQRIKVLDLKKPLHPLLVRCWGQKHHLFFWVKFTYWVKFTSTSSSLNFFVSYNISRTRKSPKTVTTSFNLYSVKGTRFTLWLCLLEEADARPKINQTMWKWFLSLGILDAINITIFICPCAT